MAEKRKKSTPKKTTKVKKAVAKRTATPRTGTQAPTEMATKQAMPKKAAPKRVAAQATAPRTVDITLVTDDDIRVRAYEIYCGRGYTPGDPAEDWLQAERELRAERS